MRRREFIALLGGAATWSLAARAQDAGRTYRIGFLLPSPRNSPAVVAMFDQLRLNGFVEGQNLIVIPGGFGVPNDQIAGVVASLVAASPDVIVAGPELPLRALSLATRTIPGLWLPSRGRVATLRGLVFFLLNSTGNGKKFSSRQFPACAK